MRTHPAAVTAALISLMAMAATSANANTFNLSPITIDTHTLKGTNGYLLFSFAPDTTGSNPVTSTVSVDSRNFSTFSLDNAGASNYELKPFTFGNTFTFTPTFESIFTPGADSGNLFSLYALDSTYTAYSTADPTGSNAAVMIVQYTDGTVSTPTTYAPFIPPVPEVSSFASFGVLVLVGLIVMFVRKRSSYQP